MLHWGPRFWVSQQRSGDALPSQQTTARSTVWTRKPAVGPASARFHHPYVPSAELEQLLQECDGQSRSIPTANGNLLPAPQNHKIQGDLGC
jgi:hypothetical protein